MSPTSKLKVVLTMNDNKFTLKKYCIYNILQGLDQLSLLLILKVNGLPSLDGTDTYLQTVKWFYNKLQPDLYDLLSLVQSV